MINNCPVCNKKRETMERYPRSVCRNCLSLYKTRDIKGNIIEYFNEGFGGGFISKKGGVNGTEHHCSVNNVLCYADEARFGGIVVSAIPTPGKFFTLTK